MALVHLPSWQVWFALLVLMDLAPAAADGTSNQYHLPLFRWATTTRTMTMTHLLDPGLFKYAQKQISDGWPPARRP